MSTVSPSGVRLLDSPDRDAVLRLAAQHGVHGVYVRNCLCSEVAGQGRTLGFHREDGVLTAIGWFGDRGNLIVLGTLPPEVEPIVQALRAQSIDWRICLGPAPIVDRIAALETFAPLVHREQLYYAVAAGQVDPARVRGDVRRAARSDVRALVEAALDLNESDLNVARYRVHRGWLKDAVKRRIRDGATWVIGPPGEPRCKLDLGSSGVAGHVIEGVHTVPAVRGEGLATGLVATVADALLASTPMVCLHVAADNLAARQAYEHAGMRVAGACKILLRG